MVLAVLAGCGGSAGDDASEPDAAMPFLDAPTHADAAPLTDAGPGSVADFADCVAPDDCASPTSDCRSVYWLSGKTVCLPRCTSSAGCPFSTFCYTKGDVPFPSQLLPMKDHCWYSLCGVSLVGEPLSSTGGPCRLGEEMGAPAADQLPGYCLPIDDGVFGLCQEVGTTTVGETCDFDVQTRDGRNCDVTSLCIGMEGDLEGVCRQMCDPRTVLSRTTGNSGCPTAQDCLDRSRISTLASGEVRRATIGWCDDVTACNLLDGPASCPARTGPADGGVSSAAQGCQPTNPVRPTGYCDEKAAGDVAAGDACVDPAIATTDAEECVAGAICVGEVATEGEDGGVASDASEALTCAQVCDLTSDTGACPASGTCEPLLWGAGYDGILGTADDDMTADWGICQP